MKETFEISKERGFCLFFGRSVRSVLALSTGLAVIISIGSCASSGQTPANKNSASPTSEERVQSLDRPQRNLERRDLGSRPVGRDPAQMNPLKKKKVPFVSSSATTGSIEPAVPAEDNSEPSAETN